MHLKMEKMFKYMNVQNGVFMISAFVEDNEIFLYDPGFRLQGEAPNIPIQAVNGFDQKEMLVNFALTGSMGEFNLNAVNNPSFQNLYTTTIWFLLCEGEISKVKGINELNAHPNVIRIIQRLFVGDVVSKDMVGTEELNYGLLGYPVLQTADILAVGGSLVPVGKDQLAHLEMSRDIARRFNHLTGTSIFQEPRPLLSQTPSVIGLDGRKMSKSYHNSIELAFSEDQTLQAIKTAVTDAKRLKKTDPGEPNDCVAVFPWYQTFTDLPTCETVASECRGGLRGCMDCKKQLAEVVNEQLRPLRERRANYAQDLTQVDAIIEAGNAVAREKAGATLSKVRQAFHLV